MSTIWHSNGKKAWGGSLGDTVWHSNGNKAWGGSSGDTVWHSNGQKLTSDGTGCSISIGEDITLRVYTDSAEIEVLGIAIPIY